MPAVNLLEANGSGHATDGNTRVALRSGGLPQSLTSFVGRQPELSSALALLQRADVRLLTLTGPGGVGKTRLALEIAARASDAFPDGVMFFELASLSDPDQLMPALVRGFEIPIVGASLPGLALSRLLRARSMLLVLDNLERLVEAAPALVELLSNCPALKILVTSRVILNVQGEHEFHVPPLSLPEHGPGRTWRRIEPAELAGYDAPALFVQRARAIQSHFAITDDNSFAIVNICRRLDGVPLAIELAAARLKVLTPEALLARLARSLDLLAGGARDQPKRLQTMRATIAWSYDLLEPDEQVLLQQLSVFVGGFTLAAAEAVCGAGDQPVADVLAGITTIVDSSLISSAAPTAADVRFEMLDTVREFGLEQLAVGGRETSTRLKHFDWCIAMALQDESPGSLAVDEATLDRLEREHDNIRAALAWSLEHGRVDAGMRLACAAWSFWFFRSYFVDGRDWMERFIERAETPDSSIYALTLGLLGMLQTALGTLQTALEQLEQATALARTSDDKRCLAICALGLADILDSQADYERAEALSREAAALFQAIEEPGWLVGALSNLAMLAHRRGDSVAAERLAEDALMTSREAGFLWGVANSLNLQARIASDAGRFDAAELLFQQSLERWHTMGDRWRVTRALTDLADMAAMTRQPERAARLLGAAEALNEPMSVSTSFAERSGWQRARSEALAQLEPEAFQQAWDAGRALAWNAAIVVALELQTHDADSTIDASLPIAATFLSPREQEVLQLLVAGHTDREIAEALFISPRTAQGHVGSIFNKLGVNSRTAAVATALQSGLVRPGDATT